MLSHVQAWVNGDELGEEAGVNVTNVTKCGGPMDIHNPIVKAGDKELCRGYSKVCFDQQQVRARCVAHAVSQTAAVVLMGPDMLIPPPLDFSNVVAD